MNDVSPPQPSLFSIGTQVVILRDIIGANAEIMQPRGAVGVVVKTQCDGHASYRIRFPDGVEETLPTAELTTLAKFKLGSLDDSAPIIRNDELFDRVIFQCIIGSQAYGLADDLSDIDRKGIYLPPADRHWSLFGIPDLLECYETQESYWELQRFLILALKANPNVLECLYSPRVEKATPLALELLTRREMFLSRLVYQTYNGYVMSQFKKMQADLRNHGQVKWKHVMHLIRLLISGIQVLQEGVVQVQVHEHRDALRAIKKGEMAWSETEKWRLSLHQKFDKAFANTKLPERPDYEQANTFLIKARQLAQQEQLP